MLLLSAEASFKPGALSFESSLLRTFLKDSSLAALPLRTKDVDIPYFVQNFLLALLAYMESAATHLTLTCMSFCCMRMQSFRRMPSLKALNETCSMNDMPVYLYVVDLRTELDGLGFLASYNGTYIMTVDADDAAADLPPANISFSCARTFLMMKDASGNPGYGGVRFRTPDESHPSA